MQKSYIWSIPTRVFHWFFVLFILLAFLSADEDRWLNYHAIIGYGVLILLIFRFFWGIMGPKYSLFKDFPTGKQKTKEFLENIFEEKQKYIGHNPLASYVMISMLIVAFLTIITGVMFGHSMSKIQIDDLKTIIKANPRRFIAQELIEFYDEECYLNNEIVPRKADFRAYVVMAEEPKVWRCGLTRYAMESGNYLVNSSQGGGFKDTWVMEA